MKHIFSIGIALALLLCSSQVINANENPITSEPFRIPLTQDTYAKEQFWYGRPYLSREIFLGYDSYSKHQRTRPHLDYSIDTLLSEGISSDDIKSATLMLWAWRQSSPIPYDIKIYPIVETWEAKSIEWSNQAPVADWHVAEIIQQNNGWQKLDITQILKPQLDGTLPPNGITIHKVLEYEIGTYFCSNEATFIPNNKDKCSIDTFPHILVELKKETVKPAIQTPKLKLINIGENYVELKIENNDLDISDFEIQQSIESTFDVAVTTNIQQTKITYENLSLGKLFYRVRSVKDDHNSPWSNVIEVEIDEKSPPETELEILSPKIAKPIPTSQKTEVEIVNKPKLRKQEDVRPEVLGKKEVTLSNDEISHCGFEYNETNSKIKTTWCSLPSPLIHSLNFQTLSTDTYKLTSIVEIPERILTVIQHNKCKKRTIWDIGTWITCKVQQVETKEYSQLVDYNFMARIGYHTYAIDEKTGSVENQFELEMETDKDLSGENIQIFAVATFSMKLDKDSWLDFKRPTTNSVKKVIPKAQKNLIANEGKPFISTFKSLVGVTQWHGYTKFQSPHKGIDFGVVKQNVYAISDGEVKAKLWDTYGSKCNSGGNALRIKHTNGMHSVYMHLESDYDGEITNLKVGDKVKKGQLVGRTGNSGEYNCQPLGYHLHFEIRKSRPQSTHIDPVAYVAADWDNIKTLNAEKIPNRLSGDNPHPGY
jgi:murein DD-endopeptidase MepM/ murein hydrolase activator NlpD